MGKVTNVFKSTKRAAAIAAATAVMALSGVVVAAPAQAEVVSTWNYARCYSQYVHNFNYHSATSLLGGKNSKVFANARYWANSSVGVGITDLFNTCSTYYNYY
jgi:hypothetical protein